MVDIHAFKGVLSLSWRCVYRHRGHGVDLARCVLKHYKRAKLLIGWLAAIARTCRGDQSDVKGDQRPVANHLSTIWVLLNSVCPIL